jgi:hypothetical protein
MLEKAKVTPTADMSVHLRGEVFQFFPYLIEDGLVIIDGFAGTLDAFEATGGKGDRAQERRALFKGQIMIFDGLGDAGQEDVEEGLFVIELTQEALIETLVFGRGEGMRIEAMAEGIFVAGLTAALARGFLFGGDILVGDGGK